MNEQQRVVVLSDQEIDCALKALQQLRAGVPFGAGPETPWGTAEAKLRKALDEPGGGTEYRLAGDKEGKTVALELDRSRSECEQAAGEFPDYENVRVQARVWGPWGDVEEAELDG